MDVAGRLGIDVAHVAPAGWARAAGGRCAGTARLASRCRAAPERDAYLPLFRLADDSEEQIQGYYQMRQPARARRRGRDPPRHRLGDGRAGEVPDGRSSSRPSRSPSHDQGRGVGRHMLADVLAAATGPWRQAGDRRHGQLWHGPARLLPEGRLPPRTGRARLLHPEPRLMRAMPSRTASRCATWSGWTSSLRRRRTARPQRPRRPAGRARRCRSWGGAAWTWPGPRSGGCAPG